MIIETKRKQEVISTRGWYRSVCVFHRPGHSKLWLFTTKGAAKAFVARALKARRTHGNDWQVFYNYTGHQTASQAVAYWNQEPTLGHFDYLHASKCCEQTRADGACRMLWTDGDENLFVHFGF